MSFEACRARMEQAGLSSWQIERFRRDYERLLQGDQGLLRESDLRPVGPLPGRWELPRTAWGPALRQTLLIKLNGGLGTTMGLTSPKGLLEVRQGMSFLDLTRAQVEQVRRQTGSALPLVLMNSFHTRQATLERLQGFSNGAIPLDFLQSQVPKLLASDFSPAHDPTGAGLEWCPPGHGEIYSALQGTGLLERLLENGLRYAFVSNIDNLGATLDPELLQWFADSGLDFAMEVTARTEQDKKGGHLARRGDGRLVLRERAQCDSADLASFEDIERHSFFNTNNLLLNLESLRNQPPPELPLIVNRKTLDPTDKTTPAVIQLETAMGAAISAFERAQAIRVERTRFLPVKNLGDLLLLRSDLYELQEDFQLRARRSQAAPTVTLDPRYYSTYHDFAERFQVIPSLIGCRSLVVQGNHYFREALVLEGDVVLT